MQTVNEAKGKRTEKYYIGFYLYIFIYSYPYTKNVYIYRQCQYAFIVCNAYKYIWPLGFNITDIANLQLLFDKWNIIDH